MNTNDAMDPSGTSRQQTTQGFLSAERPMLSESMFADLSLAESELSAKFDDIQRWQQSANVGHTGPDEHKIQAIYQACTGYLSLFLLNLQPDTGSGEEDANTLRRNLKILQIWGEAYSVGDGRLDQFATEAKEVIETVLLFLVEISSILSRRIPKLIGKWRVQDQELVFHARNHLQALIHQFEETEHSTDGDSSTSTDERDVDEDDTLHECIADLQEYVQLLNELHSSIESFLPLSEDAQGATLKEAADHGAYLYFSDIVRSRYKEAPEALADRLGQLNLERYNRLAAARDVNLQSEMESYEISQTSSELPKSTLFHDSGLGSSVPPTSLPSVSAPSMFSALAGNSRSRLPSFPRSARNRPLVCGYCGKTALFRTKREWNKHLIQDLQPYSCLDTDCQQSNEPFPCREDWIEHLREDHEMGPDWPPQWCHLCQQWTQGGMVDTCKHFADHLEDIAIAASPLNIGSDSGSDADSTKSHGNEVPDITLATISEDQEAEESSNEPVADDTTNEARITSPPPPSEAFAPDCAICNKPSTADCPTWVISHARQHILNAFERLTSTRKQAHSSYLASLPNYSIYMQYSGHPPIHPMYISQLQGQIAEAHAELKRGIDADWRASVLRYPEVLDYFYSLVELRVPSNTALSVTNPPVVFTPPATKTIFKGRARRRVPLSAGKGGEAGNKKAPVTIQNDSGLTSRATPSTSPAVDPNCYCGRGTVRAYDRCNDCLRETGYSV
ncbi:hypothetical protein BDV95DRAFT_604718 [Massariosphaeria phaeospora]|uniref:C2H2-type domain-containing protein n=1 Tax=Massariosphaeria phaeospora TaxID=100035 RepID=A0A7C8IAF4_9PLEO|nr:hypothetical protein BDV95DRAFT_604718 [Massariosphaeria phaeospora]